MQFSAHRIGLDVLQSRSWSYVEGYAASDNGAIADTQSAATSGGRRDFDHRQKSPWKSSVLDWIQSDFRWSGGVTVMDSSSYNALSRRKVRGKPAKRCTTDICALRSEPVDPTISLVISTSATERFLEVGRCRPYFRVRHPAAGRFPSRICQSWRNNLDPSPAEPMI